MKEAKFSVCSCNDCLQRKNNKMSILKCPELRREQHRKINIYKSTSFLYLWQERTMRWNIKSYHLQNKKNFLNYNKNVQNLYG